MGGCSVIAADTTDEQKAVLAMVGEFVDEQIVPVAEHYDHEDEFPEPIVQQMKELGLFGVTIPEEHGGMGRDLTSHAIIVEGLSGGMNSILGVVHTQLIGVYLLMKLSTVDKEHSYLPTDEIGRI